jgi:signal transduction histidine kinase/ligand-binding sensor domain-containing protein
VKWSDPVSRTLIVGLLAIGPLIRAEQTTAQYSVVSWGHKDGLPSNFIYSIAQTADGFLWLGTDDGLVRFDGVQFTPWRPATPNDQLLGQVRVLHVSRKRDLLIGTGSGLAGIMRNDSVEAMQLDSAVNSIQDATDGSIWVATTGELWHLAAGTLEPDEPPIQLPAAWISGPQQSSDGREWIATRAGLFYVRAGQMVHAAPEHAWLLTAPDGHPEWLDQKGTLHTLGSDGAPSGNRARARYSAEITAVMADRSGGLWIGTAGEGVVRIPGDGNTPVHYTRNDGLSSEFVRSIFEDREQNIWVGTESGLDHLRRNKVLSLTRRDGLISNAVTSIGAGGDGSVWLGTTDGLQRLHDGQTATDRPGLRILSLLIGSDQQLWAGTRAGLLHWRTGRETPAGRNTEFTSVTALAEDEDRTLWFVDADKGLFREEEGRDPVAVTNPALVHRHITAVASGPGDAAWFGLADGGVVEERQGSFHSYSVEDGLSGGAIHGLSFGPDRELWVATERGLCFLENARFVCRDSSSGIPGIRVLWALPDSHENLWLGYSIGVARVHAQQLREPKRTAALSPASTFFDDADGIINSPDLAGNAPAAIAQDGRLWLTTSQGVAVLDPEHLDTNLLPPPVHILGMDADGKAVGLIPPIRLKPLTRSLQFSFTGVCLTVPRKVRFRYRLDGFDRAWREGGTSREAFYTNLPPGHYMFRVRAANEDGIWNNAGAELSFYLAPAYFQTLWFQLLCLAALLLVAAFLFRLRLRSAQRIMRLRFEERMEERTRIAQDLHDHLVQEMVGISMQLEVADELTPRTEEAKTPLQRALMLSRSAISSGRLTLQSLRQRPVTGSALLEAMRRTAHAYPDRNGITVEYGMEGEERLLRPEVAEDLCDLGQEALRNALKHAGRGTIQVRLRYDSASFELLVRDDGTGMTEDVQRAGITGHYGLAGMRERAARIGGEFSIISAPGQGTTVRVMVPVARAYQDSRERSNSNGRRRRDGPPEPQR